MFSLLNTVVLTELIRHNAVPPTLVIAYGHAFSTVATDDEPDVKSAGPSGGGERRSGA
jgi:hypothetical protein